MTGLPPPLSLTAIASHLGVATTSLIALPTRGFGHAHVALPDRGAILRMPLSKVDLPALAEGYSLGARSGHVPRPLELIEPGPALPHGALLIEWVEGRVARWPEDAAAIGAALAAIHRLEMAPERSAIPSVAEPWHATLSSLAPTLDAPGAPVILADTYRRCQAETLSAFRPCLVLSDTHPGNFRIDAKGLAVFLDIEKHHFGHPSMDLAHAALPPSLAFAGARDPFPTPDDLRLLLAAYGEAPPDLPAWRRLIWLRTTVFALRASGPFANPEFARHVRDWRDRITDPAFMERCATHLD